MNFLFTYWGMDKEGCLGWMYTPSVREQVSSEIRKLESEARAIDRKLQRGDVNLKKLKEEVLQCYKKNQKETARRKALDLHSLRVSYSRQATEKRNVQRVAQEMQTQLSALGNDVALQRLTNILQTRMARNPPHVFTRMLERYEQLKLQSETTADMLSEMLEREVDEVDQTQDLADEEIVNNIFSELTVEDAPLVHASEYRSNAHSLQEQPAKKHS